MLDVYLIADHQPHSNDSERAGLVLAGQIESDVFDRLKRIQVIDGRFEYYTDFRWSRAVIAHMRSTIRQRRLRSSTDLQKLLNLLNLADQNTSGLVACADSAFVASTSPGKQSTFKKFLKGAFEFGK